MMNKKGLWDQSRKKIDVSCRSYIVIKENGLKNELVGHKYKDMELEVASLTKMMTLLVYCNLIDRFVD